MAITTNELVIDSFRLAGEYREDETPEPDKITEGVRYLNRIIRRYSGNGVYIPFYDKKEFAMTIGKNSYEFSTLDTADIVSSPISTLDFVNIVQNRTDIPVQVIDESQQYLRVTTEGTNGRPRSAYLTRQSDTSTLSFYPGPAFAYNCIVRAKFILADAQENALLPLPANYEDLLYLELSKRLAWAYKQPWDQLQEAELKEVRGEILSSNDMDLNIKQSSALKPYSSIYNHYDYVY